MKTIKSPEDPTQLAYEERELDAKCLGMFDTKIEITMKTPVQNDDEQLYDRNIHRQMIKNIPDSATFKVTRIQVRSDSQIKQD